MYTYPKIQQVSEFEYELDHTFFYYSKRKKCSIRISKGFRYDGASIPRFFWRIVGTPFTGRYTAAAMIHDALYAGEIFSREDCDLIFHDAMIDYLTPWWQRQCLYWAVRMFGWVIWDGYHYPELMAEARKMVTLFR
jgi:hypothetical protein